MKRWVALLALVPSVVFATGGVHEADSQAVAVGLGAAQATGGDSSAVATGGAGGLGGAGGAGGSGVGHGGAAHADNSQQQTAEGGSASNVGNITHVSTRVQRAAPSLGQGGLYNSGCGAGFNGGGSQPGGAGFLGLTWTTHDCYLFLLAQRYEAIGMPDTACDVLNKTRAARRAFKKLKIDPPDCTILAPEEVIEQVPISEPPYIRDTRPNPPTNVVVDPDYVTRKELAERDKRMIERLTGK